MATTRTLPGTTVKPLARYASLFEQEPATAAVLTPRPEAPRFGFGSKGANRAWTTPARTERRDVKL